MPCLQRRWESGPIYKGLLPRSIQVWENDCWSNKVIEEQLDQSQIPSSKLEQYCMGCWPGPTGKRARAIHKQIPPSALGQSSKTNTAQNLESNNTTWVAYRANGYVNSVSNIIVKHRHRLVTDGHRLPIVPMVPNVPQSAPMASVADASVKLYEKCTIK